MSKQDWKSELDKVSRSTATEVIVVRLDGERLLVFKNGESLKFNDRGKVVAFLDGKQTEQERNAR